MLLIEPLYNWHSFSAGACDIINARAKVKINIFAVLIIFGPFCPYSPDTHKNHQKTGGWSLRTILRIACIIQYILHTPTISWSIFCPFGHPG
jgi:hypothetical protein